MDRSRPAAGCSFATTYRDAAKTRGSSTVALGVAEMRNDGYGTGHGQRASTSGLGLRHARLVIDAAKTGCEFILDTLSDPSAPWRKGQ